jgi:hypothetical protein
LLTLPEVIRSIRASHAPQPGSFLLPYFDEGKIAARFRTDRTLRMTAPSLPMIKC